MNDLRETLRDYIVTVRHRKNSGEWCQRRVTLKESAIPEDKRPNGNGRVAPADMIRAFDVELNEWRTLIIPTVEIISIEAQ